MLHIELQRERRWIGDLEAEKVDLIAQIEKKKTVFLSLSQQVAHKDRELSEMETELISVRGELRRVEGRLQTELYAKDELSRDLSAD